MRYLSVCSGIEAASVAWHQLGWVPAAFSEIDTFPRAVLAHHYPNVPLHGDFTTIQKDDYGAVDLIVGGTPCQDFSVAGLRQGLAGARGNLTLEFLRLVERKKPRWVVWENVPGILSLDKGRAFGAFLGGLAECGYGFAYRVLDAQYFGVPQRRRRVFVIGHIGNWQRAAAVLFERESLLRDTTPGRQKGEGVAGTLKGGSGSRGYPDPSDGNGGGLISGTIEASAGKRRGSGINASALCADTAPTLDQRSGRSGENSFATSGGLIPQSQKWPAEIAPTLNAHFGNKQGLENQHIEGGGWTVCSFQIQPCA